MPYSEAIRTLHSMAVQNQIGEEDIAFGDNELRARAKWQKKAIDALGSAIEALSDSIDADFKPGLRAQPYADGVLDFDRSADPSDPLSALLIVFDIAETGALFAEQNILSDELEKEGQRQATALDLVFDFISLHKGAYAERVSAGKTADPSD
jgi:hypothetical protein